MSTIQVVRLTELGRKFAVESAECRRCSPATLAAQSD